MSSHHEWVEQGIAHHDALKPFAPENGRPLAFKVGDSVIYTNPAGCEFKQRISGLYRPDQTTAQYALGARYLIDSDSPWVPVAESSLRHDAQASLQTTLQALGNAALAERILCATKDPQCPSGYTHGANYQNSERLYDVARVLEGIRKRITQADVGCMIAEAFLTFAQLDSIGFTASAEMQFSRGKPYYQHAFTPENCWLVEGAAQEPCDVGEAVAHWFNDSGDMDKFGVAFGLDEEFEVQVLVEREKIADLLHGETISGQSVFDRLFPDVQPVAVPTN